MIFIHTESLFFNLLDSCCNTRIIAADKEALPCVKNVM